MAMMWQEKQFVESAVEFIDFICEWLIVAEDIIEKLRINLKELYANEEKKNIL
jgi:hypothetical protein